MSKFRRSWATWVEQRRSAWRARGFRWSFQPNQHLPSLHAADCRAQVSAQRRLPPVAQTTFRSHRFQSLSRPLGRCWPGATRVSGWPPGGGKRHWPEQSKNFTAFPGRQYRCVRLVAYPGSARNGRAPERRHDEVGSHPHSAINPNPAGPALRFRRSFTPNTGGVRDSRGSLRSLHPRPPRPCSVQGRRRREVRTDPRRR
jgi:hypothetical protein